MAQTPVPAQTNAAPPATATSEFSYEPPAYRDDSGAARDEQNASIAEIEAEFAADAAKEWLDDEAPADDAALEDGAPQDLPVEEEADDEPADPKKDRYFERVVQRELAAKEAESKASTRMAEVEAKLAELKDLSGLKSSKDLKIQFENDPWGALQAMGHDPATTIRLALAQEVLKKGPPTDPSQLKSYNELKEFADKSESKRELAAMKAELAQEKQVRAQQEFFNTVHAKAREYVKTVGDSTPTLALVSKADPDTAFSEIWEEITRDAQIRAATDPNGEHMSFEQAAKNVEARLSKWQKLLVQNSTTAPTQGKKPNVTPPQAKAPAKPLMPWESSQADIYDVGLKEAMREFHRVEAAEKQRRR